MNNYIIKYVIDKYNNILFNHIIKKRKYIDNKCEYDNNTIHHIIYISSYLFDLIPYENIIRCVILTDSIIYVDNTFQETIADVICLTFKYNYNTYTIDYHYDYTDMIISRLFNTFKYIDSFYRFDILISNIKNE